MLELLSHRNNDKVRLSGFIVWSMLVSWTRYFTVRICGWYIDIWKAQSVIDNALKVFEEVRLGFTEEQDVFDFLGVEVLENKTDNTITLLQRVLTEKVIRSVGMEEENIEHTPDEVSPLGKDPENKLTQ